jgi:hypothetical protein
VQGIAKSADGVAADVKREADVITKPKHWYEKILGPVYTIGRLNPSVSLKTISDTISAVAASLEREAGHNLLSAALVLAGILLIDPAQKAQVSHDLIVCGLGVLARSMGAPK